MIVTCQECSTRFELDESLLKPEGSKLRCSKCKHIFFFSPETLESEPVETQAEDLEDQALEPDDSGSQETTSHPLETEDDFGPLEFDSEETAPDPLEAQSEEDPESEPLLDEFEGDGIPPAGEDPGIEIDENDDLGLDAGLEMDDAGLDFDETDLEFDDLGMKFDEDPESDSALEDDEELDFGGTLEEDESLVGIDGDIEFDEDLEKDSAIEFDEALENGNVQGEDKVEENKGSLGLDEDLEDDQTLEMDDSLELDDDEIKVDDALEIEEENISFDDELEFQELDETTAPPKTADIEISFDKDEEISFSDAESEPDQTKNGGRQDFEFEDDDDLVLDDASLEIEGVDISPGTDELGGLELEGFDLEPVEGDLFLEPADDQEESAGQITLADLDDGAEKEGMSIEMEMEPGQEDLYLDPTPEDMQDNIENFEVAIEDESDDEKFSAYDQVLDQDIELDDDSLDIDLQEDIKEPEPKASTPDAGEQKGAALIGKTPGDTPPSRPRPKRRKKRSGMGAPIKILLLLFFLVACLAAASLYLGYKIPFLSEIKIPYLEQLLKRETQPAQALKPIPSEPSIKGRFVSNATAGELFIITGKIENPSSISYDHVRVKGTLITKEKVKARIQTVYCGNIISEEDLKKGNISDITSSLAIKDGARKANINIMPGKKVPFMLVFSNLPENLENFTVEVAGFKKTANQN